MSSKIGKLVHSLEDLKSFNNCTPELARLNHSKVENLLDLIFDIGRKQTNFTDEQKRSVGPLLLNAIRPIQINIEQTALKYRTSLESSVLRKRSAIEFLLKNYGDLPVGQGFKLSEKLTSSNIEETISILDEIIIKWRDVSDSDEEDSNRGIPEIPTSHTWWSL